jgi:hypothetical protein
MKMNKWIFFSLGCLISLSACAPKISTNITNSYPALDYREDVWVFGVEDPVPDSAETLGVIKIGDSGFSTSCGWEEVIEKAKMEARTIGGNSIKITNHSLPSIWSTCHRITANILKVKNLDDFNVQEAVDSALINADYALLHVYRYGGTGALISYDLHLGDTLIGRVSRNWKKTIKIDKDGLNTLWARTEAKVELPINIQFGHAYYVRCSVVMGAFVGRPKLELVNSQTGKVEIQSIKTKTK